MRLIINAVCDMGCVRSNNEDMVLIQGMLIRDSSIPTMSIDVENQFIAAVADGMGGHNAGEVASEMTLKSLNNLLIGLDKDLTEEQVVSVLENWIQAIHSEVTQMGIENPECNGMGTTLAGILGYKDNLFVFHAGDSRVYRLRDNFLKQITVDHSLREMTGNPDAPSNVICNSIGGGGSNQAYLTVKIIQAFEGDEFIICSDGLSDMIDDETIERVAASDGYCDMLVSEAKKAGGKDNISVVRLKVDNAQIDNELTGQKTNEEDEKQGEDEKVDQDSMEKK